MEIREKFMVIEDPRHPSYVEHKLADVLIIVMCAILSGLDTLGDIVIYARNNREFLQATFGIEKIPSKATIARILGLVDGAKVGAVIVEIMRELMGVEGEIVAVDGKAICSTGKAGQPHSALQILTAYITDNGVVLGQEAIHEKTNEIPVFQEMLAHLDIKNKTITADAMHCQRETCQKIINKKGNYVLGLKRNQLSLYEDVDLFFSDQNHRSSVESHTTVEKNAGRIETRVCKKITDISWLAEHKWPGLSSVFSIQRTVDTRGRISEETSYYISSLDEHPQRLMQIAREHWKIESMHWMLDVTFSEDTCRFLEDNAHKTLNSMRKFALALHKHFLSSSRSKSSIKANMLACLINHHLLLSLLRGL